MSILTSAAAALLLALAGVVAVSACRRRPSPAPTTKALTFDVVFSPLRVGDDSAPV